MSVEIWLGIVVVILAALGGIVSSITPSSFWLRTILVGCFVILGVIAVWLVVKASREAAQTASQKGQEALQREHNLQSRLDRIDLKIGQILSPRVKSPPLGPTARYGRLSLSMEGANIYTPSDPPNSTAIVVLATIHNSSNSPTVANDFSLEVTTSDGVKHSGILLRLGKEKELTLTSKAGIVKTIPGADALEEKTYNREIIAGGSVMGQAWFLLPGVAHDFVIDPATLLRFSAKDSKGETYEDTESIAEISRK